MKLRGRGWKNLLFILVILCSMLSSSTSWAYEYTEIEVLSNAVYSDGGDYLYKKLVDGTISIYKYTGTETDLVIPEEIDGYTVTDLWDRAFEDCDSLISVTIPSSVKTMGVYAFRGCDNLVNVTILPGLEMIWAYAFAECENLTNIAIPSSVELIWDDAFEGCRSLKSITIPSGVTEIGKWVFVGCGNLASVTIPGSVTKIGTDAFSGDMKFYFLGDAPESVSGAFRNCTSIAYYPENNDTWTDEKMAAFGGNITWVPYCGTIQNISGTITSYGDMDGTVEITLLNDGEEISYIETADGTYQFASIPADTYTLQFCKQNHVTRTCEITVGSESITQDVKICLQGDVTGDGKVNTRDLNRIYAHVNGTDLLTEYPFACGDVTGTDGKLNTRDLNRLYAHINESDLLW